MDITLIYHSSVNMTHGISLVNTIQAEDTRTVTTWYQHLRTNLPQHCKDSNVVTDITNQGTKFRYWIVRLKIQTQLTHIKDNTKFQENALTYQHNLQLHTSGTLDNNIIRAVFLLSSRKLSFSHGIKFPLSINNPSLYFPLYLPHTTLAHIQCVSF